VEAQMCRLAEVRPVSFMLLNEKLLAIPDRPGNNRLDSFANILSQPAVGLIFLVAGF
jgi:predicted pyridoxine 5'-phosphate oxidase superfamily flavin-nucleotide-binding protein